MNFEQLSPDLIIEIGLYLEIDEIFSYCLISTKFNYYVCENRFFWLLRLKMDYGITKDRIPDDTTAKDYYRYIHTILADRNNRAGLNDLLKNAVKFGNIRLVGLALDAGAQVDHASGYILKQAVVNRDMDMIKYLMSRGANYEIQNNIVLAIAARVGDISIYKYFRELGVVPDRFILARALYEASRFGQMDIVKYLVEEENADVQHKNNEAVKIAMQKGHQEVVDYLLSRGASLD